MRAVTTISTKKVILAIVIMALALFSWHIFENRGFHLTKTNPRLKEVTTSSAYMDISFNEPISSKNLSISSEPNIIEKISTEDAKSLRVIWSQPLLTDHKYSISIKSIFSTDGQQIKNKTLKFKVINKPFVQLSKKQQEEIINSQDRPDSSLVTNDPLVAHLPYGDLGYNINYTVATKDNKPALVVQVSVILAEADYRQSPQGLQNTINQREEEALGYIRSLGLDPAKYNIQYIVPPH